MLAKENRLRKEKDFGAIFKGGKTFKEGFLVLKTIKNNLDIDRFGFIISQKVSKKATVRNRIKRKIREIIRVNIKNSLSKNIFCCHPANTSKKESVKDNKKDGLDAALIILPGIDKENFLETKENLIKLLKKANLIEKQQ
jgi:ribonuclease P protein component